MALTDYALVSTPMAQLWTSVTAPCGIEYFNVQKPASMWARMHVKICKACVSLPGKRCVIKDVAMRTAVRDLRCNGLPLAPGVHDELVRDEPEYEVSFSYGSEGTLVRLT